MPTFREWLLGPAPAPPAPPPTAGGLEATVSHEPALVTIYAPDGATAQVRREELAGWLTRGFRLTRADLPAEVADLPAKQRAAEEALAGLVNEAVARGAYHPATLAAAEVAASEVARALARILTDAQLAYRALEPEPVAMRDAEGKEHRVDPGQVDHYRTQGWTEVRA